MGGGGEGGGVEYLLCVFYFPQTKFRYRRVIRVQAFPSEYCLNSIDLPLQGLDPVPEGGPRHTAEHAAGLEPSTQRLCS